MHLFGLFTLQLVPLLDEEGGKSQLYKLLKKRKIRSFFFTCELNLLWQHVCVGHVVPTPNNKKNPKACKQHKLWTGPVLASYRLLDLSYGCQTSIFPKKNQGRICISKNNSINYTSQLHIHYLKKRLLVMNTSVENFQNMMDMQKDYAYKFSNFVALKKLIRIRSSLSKQTQHEQNPKQNNLGEN
jgi:hypothetical protein